MNTIYKILKILFLGSIPALLLFVGQWNGLNTYLIVHKFKVGDVEQAQLVSFILGCLVSTFIYPLCVGYYQSNLETERKKHIKSVQSLAGYHANFVKECMKGDLKNLNTRIFVPEKKSPAYLKIFRNKEKHFRMTEIDHITSLNEHKKLKFLVEPEEKSQGIVGKAYNEKNLHVDFDVNIDKYVLDDYQKRITEDVTFCCAAPIFGENNEVIAILSFDSNTRLAIPKSNIKKWRSGYLRYCAFLGQHIQLK